MNDRILLATGGEPGVEQAIVHAVDLADAYEATLYAVYVVDESVPESDIDDEFTAQTEGVEAALEAAGANALEAVVEKADEIGIPIETSIRYGHPAEEIVEAAAENDADVIIMGSRTLPEEEGSRVGSVADEVVQATDRSVTVVKTPVPAE